MSTPSDPSDLIAALGGEPLALAEALEPSERATLAAAIHAARAAEQRALDAAITRALEGVPLLLRGAVRKVLFP